MKRSLLHIWAIAKKELRLELRFIFPLLANSFFNPIKFLVWFFIIYYGFYNFSTTQIGIVSKDNYLVFLFLGALFHIYYNIATAIFPGKFVNEKYWKTFQGFLISPINSFKMLLGISLSEFIKVLISFIFITLIIFFIWPIPLWKFFVIFIIIITVFFGLMALGLIRGVLFLVNENMSSLMEYFFLGLGFISCFYYPIESLPRFLHYLVEINPIYHGITLARSIWFSMPINFFSFIYIIVFSATSIVVSGIIYRNVLKKFDIEGY